MLTHTCARTHLALHLPSELCPTYSSRLWAFHSSAVAVGTALFGIYSWTEAHLMEVTNDCISNRLSTFSTYLTKLQQRGALSSPHSSNSFLCWLPWQFCCTFLCLPMSLPFMTSGKVISVNGGFYFPHPHSPLRDNKSLGRPSLLQCRGAATWVGHRSLSNEPQEDWGGMMKGIWAKLKQKGWRNQGSATWGMKGVTGTG